MTATIEVNKNKIDEKEVAEKLKNPNIFPIENKLVIKCVDFVDITEFNNQTVIAAEFDEKQTEFLNTHAKLNKELIEKISAVLEEAGLIVHFRESFGRRYDAQRSERENCMRILSAGGNLEELLKGTPPPHQNKDNE